MSIRSSLYFVYNGIDSRDMGIYNVSISENLFEEIFLPTRKINEVKIKGRDRPYFQYIEREPLEFGLSFAFEDKWDRNLLRSVARWLNQDYFKPLYFSDNPDRIFFAILEGDSNLIHNGLSQGYITLNVRCDSPYSYSDEIIVTYDFSDNDINETMFSNLGDVTVKPEIWIEKVGSGDLSIVNQPDDGMTYTFLFENLVDGEVIYVDNENEYIETSIPGKFRYADFNDEYLEFIVGENHLTVNGRCKLQFRYRLKYLQ